MCVFFFKQSYFVPFNVFKPMWHVIPVTILNAGQVQPITVDFDFHGFIIITIIYLNNILMKNKVCFNL